MCGHGGGEKCARGPDAAHGLGRMGGEQSIAGVCLQGSQGRQEKPELPLPVKGSRCPALGTQVDMLRETWIYVSRLQGSHRRLPFGIIDMVMSLKAT